MKKNLKKMTRFVFVGFILLTILLMFKDENLKCDVDLLVLDETKMPIGWKNKWGILPPALDTLGAEQAYGMSMEKNEEGAGHTVYKYRNKWLAIFYLRFNKEIYFPSMGWNWSELKEAKNLPLQADQIQIKCGDSNYKYLDDGCSAVLRYGSYISDFGLSRKDDKIPTEEFIDIVLKIDEQFRQCKQ